MKKSKDLSSFSFGGGGGGGGEGTRLLVPSLVVIHCLAGPLLAASGTRPYYVLNNTIAKTAVAVPVP